MPCITKKLRVKNDLGLHTRPATLIVKILQDYCSTVSFTYKKQTVDAKSILCLLMLAAPKNAEIAIAIDGVDAEEAMERLVGVFEEQFGEK